MSQTSDSGAAVAAKIVSVWAAIGITSWTEAAAFLGFIYTACMLVHWWWKTFWRDFFRMRGWFLPHRRRRPARREGPE